MDDNKHTIVKIKNRTFFLILAVSIALGFIFAYETVNQYEIFVRAILGITVIILLIASLSPITRKVEEPAEIQLELPKDLRYFVYGFLKATIFFWALVQIVKLITFLLT